MEDYEISYMPIQEWDDGGVAEIIITNHSTNAIEDWILTFDSDIEIEDVWGANLVSHAGQRYVVRNASYAQNIECGSVAVL